MKKYFISILVIVFTILVLPFCVFAETTNSGFIPGQIWYSKATLTEGDTVNIHTAVWNGEKSSVSAKVEFYDKNIILGSRDVVLATLELKDVSVPWKITSGDHTISAKITSSTATVSGKKENVVLSRVTTTSDKQFVPVLVKDSNGTPVANTDVLKNQLENVSSKITDILPEKVNTSLSNSFVSIEDFRNNTLDTITEARDVTKKELDLMDNSPSSVKGAVEKVVTNSDIQSGTKKPINYVKLFFLEVLAFIFSNKIVFYGVTILIVFFVLRFIYRKIRNR